MLLFVSPIAFLPFPSKPCLKSLRENIRSLTLFQPCKTLSTTTQTIQSSLSNQSSTSTAEQYEDDGTRVIPVPIFLAATHHQLICGVYALLDTDKEVMYVGMSRDVSASIATHYEKFPHYVSFVKVMTFKTPVVREMKLVSHSWILDNEITPFGNLQNWFEADVELVQQAQLIPIQQSPRPVSTPVISPFQNGPLGINDKNMQQPILELTSDNVHLVLDKVRPFLLADGGNVSVIHVDKHTGKVELKLEGACSSCASATTTMSLGIEKVLQERFGDKLKQVVAVDDHWNSDDLSLDLCERALDPIRSVLRGLGADVSVTEIEDGEVILSFVGPSNLKYGVEQALMQKVPGVEAVTFE